LILGAREVCDQGHWAPGPGRYHWTVTAFGEPDPVAAGRTGKLAEARHGQRAGRVAARSPTLCLFCPADRDPMPHTSGRSGRGWEGYPRRRSPLASARPDRDRQAVSIVPAGGQRGVIWENWAVLHSDFLARVSHPTERASGRRASDLSLAMHSVPKRQTKGSGKVAPRCPAQTNG
jgi:hypothetical protein